MYLSKMTASILDDLKYIVDPSEVRLQTAYEVEVVPDTNEEYFFMMLRRMSQLSAEPKPSRVTAVIPLACHEKVLSTEFEAVEMSV